MSTSFYTPDELGTLGLRTTGNEVLISRKVSIYRAEAISIGNRVRIDDFCILSGGSGLELGDFIHIGAYSALYAGAGIIMEDFSGLSARVTIYSESDDFTGRSLSNPTVPDRYRPHVKRGRILMRRHALVGSNSTVLPGVELCEGTAVGAHSLVNKDCEPWSIYSGVPAKKLHRRRKDLLKLEEQLLRECSSA